MTYIVNLLPKIKTFARGLIIIGNFVLELYSMIVTTYSQAKYTYSTK